jgi:hypothetical protein
MDVLRKILAAAIALRGVTNFGKPFAPESAFVVFGSLMRGVWSTVVAPLFGAAMLYYAWLLWRRHPAARSLGIAYAVWATANVVLFPLIEGVPVAFEPCMYAVFAVPGIVVPWLAVWTVRRP